MARKPKILEIPARMNAPDSGIDTQDFRRQLTHIATTSDNVRGDVLSLFKQTLTDAIAFAKKRFDAGRLDGLETARLLASIHDDIVRALFDYTTTHVQRVSNPTKAEYISLCAVGGFGRGEMAPESDLDLLFLISDNKGSAYTEQVTEYILYMLWDMGLKVGHAVRTIDQSIKLAKEDQTILTSLLDIRYLAGMRR